MKAAKPQLSAAIEWQIVAKLFEQKAALLLGGLSMPLVAVLAWRVCNQTWLLWWALGSILILAARLLIAEYFRRRATVAAVKAWTRVFIACAWAMGVSWGCAGLTIAAGFDPVLQLAFFSCRAMCVMGGASRNAGILAAARGQVVLGVVPSIIACASSGKPLYSILMLLMIVEMAGAFTIMKNVNGAMTEALTLNEENIALIERLRQTSADLAAANSRLETVAMTDALTGIANRRRFDLVLAAELSRAQRYASPLALLLIDIDWFKKFNDRCGHIAGDECLRRVAQTVARVPARPSDLVARYGGEEFVAILPQIDVPGALAVAERVRAAIQELGIAHAAVPTGVVTVSIGVAPFLAEWHRSAADLVGSADMALYAAKAAGRNCVREAATLLAS